MDTNLGQKNKNDPLRRKLTFVMDHLGSRQALFRKRSSKPTGLARVQKTSTLLTSTMSIKEILEELPKLTLEEKRQLWNVLDHELTSEEDDESPELLAAIDEAIRSVERGEKTYTIEEVREHIAQVVERARTSSED
jgi:hypothetical protein